MPQKQKASAIDASPILTCLQALVYVLSFIAANFVAGWMGITGEWKNAATVCLTFILYNPTGVMLSAGMAILSMLAGLVELFVLRYAK